MNSDKDAEAVTQTLAAINSAWMERRPREMGPFLHERFVTVAPGFAGRALGRDAAIAGFESFGQQATVIAFHRDEPQVDVVGDAAVATITFEMTYKLAGQAYQSTGRDIWVFAREGDAWLAVWRTMLDVREAPVEA